MVIPSPGGCPVPLQTPWALLSEIVSGPQSPWPGLPTTPACPHGLSTGLQDNLSPDSKGPPVHLGTIVGIVLAVLLVAALILAGIYISGHPNSNAALFFIEVSVDWA